jgi:hypothetical protein
MADRRQGESWDDEFLYEGLTNKSTPSSSNPTGVTTKATNPKKTATSAASSFARAQARHFQQLN